MDLVKSNIHNYKCMFAIDENEKKNVQIGHIWEEM